MCWLCGCSEYITQAISPSARATTLEAARLGVITAGLKTRGRGAIPGLPHRQEAYQIFHSRADG